MKVRGGYNISLEGRPASDVTVLPEVAVLNMPLSSRRFSFSKICVAEGDRVRPGQILATDPDNYDVPLLAPRGGTVRLTLLKRHIVLEDVAQEPEGPYDSRHDAPHIAKDGKSSEAHRQKLLACGAWQFVEDAYEGSMPDPFGTPQAVIVSVLRLEPFMARGDVQLKKRIGSFVRGLEQLQSLLEYQPIYLALPDQRSSVAKEISERIKGYAWVKPVQVPVKYPHDDFALVARRLGLQRSEESPVWAMRVQGVLALDRALTVSRPCTVRLISLAGPMVDSPVHLKAMPGYPLDAILAGRTSGSPFRVISGGALTGHNVSVNQKGLDTECCGLTILPEQCDREFLAFTRPGWDRRSYAGCFLSSLRGEFEERLTTAMRGERRPCIACGFCEDVCPAGIMPYLIHKLIYNDEIEEVEQARVDLCIGCGLCSFVCPSKIDLRSEFLDAQQAIREELAAQEAQE